MLKEVDSADGLRMLVLKVLEFAANGFDPNFDGKIGLAGEQICPGLTAIISSLFSISSLSKRYRKNQNYLRALSLLAVRL